MKRKHTVLLVCTAGVLFGCERDRLDISCPEVSAGDLVVSEIRGAQSGDGVQSEWIELFNTSTSTIELAGLGIRFLKLDGSDEINLLVRANVSIPGHGYAVFGREIAGAEPEFVDYGYISDIDRTLYDSAAVQLSSCGQNLDQVVYRNLPGTGTFILNGTVTPSISNNDDEENWCVDSNETSEGAALGTPGMENPPC